MITTLLLGLSIVLLLFTAQPLIRLRKWLSKKINGCTGWRRDLVTVLNCPPCLSFWVAIPLYFLVPHLPEFLIYAIYLSTIVTIVNWYLDQNRPSL